MPLPREFFARHAVEVAPDLLGCVLERQTAEGLVAVELTEVEAYAGRSDPASHAYRGKTPRNAVMFGPPGHAYVYFTYGMHFCVNIVCLGEEGPLGDGASAVLLRAGAVIAGADLALARRARGPARVAARDLARGPARLCQALGIDRSLDGADVCAAASALRVRAGASTPARSGTVPARGDDPPGTPRGTVPARGDDPPGSPRGTVLARGDDPPGTLRGSVPARGDDPPGSPRGTVLARGDDPPGTPRRIAVGPRVGVSRAGEFPWRFWLDGDPTVSVYRPYAPRKRTPVTP